jgi:putative redox protein
MLAARLELPELGAPTACAVFAHCFTCSKDSKAAVTISRALAALGMAVLRFDFTGLGDSEGEFAETTYSGSVSDIVAAARFMESMLHAPRLLIGHSLGGAAVLRAARELPDVRAVVTIGAPSEPAHVTRLFAKAAREIADEGSAPVAIGHREFTISRTLVEDLRAATLLDAVAGLGRPLLIMHAPGDRVVSVDHAARLYTAAKHPKSFVSLDDADHLLTRAADAEYAAAVVSAWASRYLMTVPSTSRPTERGTPPDQDVAERAQARATTRDGDNFRTALLAGGHSLLSDEPVAVGGTNTGPAPFDLLAAALASCTSMTLQQYARRKQWPLERAIVRVTHHRVRPTELPPAGPPRPPDRLQREVELVGPLDATQVRRLLEIADRCPVHRTLSAGVEITTTANSASPHA